MNFPEQRVLRITAGCHFARRVHRLINPIKQRGLMTRELFSSSPGPRPARSPFFVFLIRQISEREPERVRRTSGCDRTRARLDSKASVPRKLRLFSRAAREIRIVNGSRRFAAGRGVFKLSTPVSIFQDPPLSGSPREERNGSKEKGLTETEGRHQKPEASPEFN